MTTRLYECFSPAQVFVFFLWLLFQCQLFETDSNTTSINWSVTRDIGSPVEFLLPRKLFVVNLALSRLTLFFPWVVYFLAGYNFLVDLNDPFPHLPHWRCRCTRWTKPNRPSSPRPAARLNHTAIRLISVWSMQIQMMCQGLLPGNMRGECARSSNISKPDCTRNFSTNLSDFQF